MRQIKILFADDHDLVLQTIQQLLELEGWHVDVSRDGAAAWEKIKGSEHYDVFILDAEMPGMKGMELLHGARTLEHRRHVPIIMFTASDYEAEALSAGASAFLKKPDDINVLIETVKLLLAKSTATFTAGERFHQ